MVESEIMHKLTKSAYNQPSLIPRLLCGVGEETGNEAKSGQDHYYIF